MKRKRRKAILSAIEQLDKGYGCHSGDIVRKVGDSTSCLKSYSKIAKDLWELKDKGLVEFQQTGTNILTWGHRNVRLTPKYRSKWLLYRDGITAVSAIVGAIASVAAFILDF